MLGLHAFAMRIPKKNMPVMTKNQSRVFSVSSGSTAINEKTIITLIYALFPGL